MTHDAATTPANTLGRRPLRPMKLIYYYFGTAERTLDAKLNNSREIYVRRFIAIHSS